MRGGNCLGGAAFETATGKTSSVGAGGAEAAASDATSATGSAATAATGSIVSVAAATIGTAGAAALAFRFGSTRLTVGAGGGGISVMVAESGGRGSEPPEGRSGHTETIRCVSREATTAQTSVRVGCCRIQWSGQALRIEVMRCVSASVESGSGERG